MSALDTQEIAKHRIGEIKINRFKLGALMETSGAIHANERRPPATHVIAADPADFLYGYVRKLYLGTDQTIKDAFNLLRRELKRVPDESDNPLYLGRRYHYQVRRFGVRRGFEYVIGAQPPDPSYFEEDGRTAGIPTNNLRIWLEGERQYLWQRPPVLVMPSIPILVSPEVGAHYAHEGIRYEERPSEARKRIERGDFKHFILGDLVEPVSMDDLMDPSRDRFDPQAIMDMLIVGLSSPLLYPKSFPRHSDHPSLTTIDL